MRKSRLKQTEANLFQRIKKVCAEAEDRGVKLYKLSIGQPTGAALATARKAASRAVMSADENMHEYQDNGSPGVPDFAERFVQMHVSQNLKRTDTAFLPVPGIKPTIKQVIQACGGICGERISVATMTDPGYPTPEDQCRYLNQNYFRLRTNQSNRFLPEVLSIPEETDLIMVNFPNNPSGQIAVLKYWEELCSFCSESNIRLWNDAAYIMLSHVPESCTLTEVAIDFPELSWAEGFSASKLIQNGTGWRVGAVAGSSDFIADIAKIKGNDDSGFVAPMAAGVITALEEDIYHITECRDIYGRRLTILIDTLRSYGMRLAVYPYAGFFTLWMTPSKAFGQRIKDAEHFNYLMIEKTGIVGVHFHPYIRYAVCGDIENMMEAIHSAFKQADISY